MMFTYVRVAVVVVATVSFTDGNLRAGVDHRHSEGCVWCCASWCDRRGGEPGAH